MLEKIKEYNGDIATDIYAKFKREQERKSKQKSIIEIADKEMEVIIYGKKKEKYLSMWSNVFYMGYLQIK